VAVTDAAMGATAETVDAPEVPETSETAGPRIAEDWAA
jgi:hypothetical protein